VAVDKHGLTVQCVVTRLNVVQFRVREEELIFCFKIRYFLKYCIVLLMVSIYM
jgi:hypothetical protein